eukprot:204341_1
MEHARSLMTSSISIGTNCSKTLNDKPFMNATFSINEDSLTLIIDVELEYLGWAYADNHSPGYGVTYVLDFEDYDAEQDDIREAGTCQNRLAANFTDPPEGYPGLWNYSATPMAAGHVGAFPYSAYPPAGPYWGLTSNGSCTRILYHGEFSWYDLLGCQDYGETISYTTIVEDADWVNQTGVFYINIVSPLSLNSDTGYYRVYQSLSAPFVIAVRKQINIISSVGIDLFVMSIIAVYKDDVEEDWHMVLLTEAADFLELNSPSLLTAPTDISEGGENYTVNFQVDNSSINTGCMSSGYLCLQLWEISIENVTCPPTNFTGVYTLQFNVGCNSAAAGYDNATDLCLDYIAQYNASGVTLSADLEWLDEVCDATIFLVEFEATMTFHTDATFATELGDSDQYAIGDTAYVQVEIDTADFDLLGLDLDNVWVCTTSPDNEPLEIDDQNLGTSACLSVDVDANWPHHIVSGGVENDNTLTGNVTIYSTAPNNTVWFSFPIDSSVERVNLYVQAQLTLDLTPSSRRRRMLLQAEEGATVNQARHFSGAIAVTDEPLEQDEGIAGDDIITRIEAEEEELPAYVVSIVSVVVTAAICLCCFFVVGLCYRQKKIKEANQQMASVSA